jgi:glycolate oxidase FAD binding subunit
VIEQFQHRIRAAAAAGTPLRIRGGGTKEITPVAGEVLDTTGHAGIVAYEPTELYVTARCGTRLDELERALAAEGQMLAFEQPRFGAAGTVGGMVASGLSGPRRMQAGALRDFVLGTRVIDGRGDHLRFGGQVMKNVAGYDVSRLLAGSRGTLGLITEVSLKVMPVPAAELSLRFELGQAEAIARVNEWAGRPLPISASAWHARVLMLRLSGAPAAIAAARARLGGEPVADVEAREFWDAVRDHAHPSFAGAPWRLALPSTTPPLALPAEPFIEWTGALRWLPGELDPATVHTAAQDAGGHATRFRAGEAPAPLPAPLAQLHARVRHAFDPAGIFR